MKNVWTVTKLILDEIVAERSYVQCIRELDSSQSPVRYFLAECGPNSKLDIIKKG